MAYGDGVISRDELAASLAYGSTSGNPPSAAAPPSICHVEGLVAAMPDSMGFAD